MTRSLFTARPAGRGVAPGRFALIAALASAVPAAGTAAVAVAQSGANPGLPRQAVGIGIEEKLGEAVPLDLGFTDSTGKPVMLRDFFAKGRPVVLTFNYSNCPILCHLQLDGFVKALKDLDWTAGREFEIVTIGLDPKEGPVRADQTKKRHLQGYFRADAESRAAAERGWHFLLGSENNIRAAADACGFKYVYDEESKEYRHPSALLMLTPEGKVARYLYPAGGLVFETDTVRKGLIEAADGKIGSPTEQALLNSLLMFCYHYDAEKGVYTKDAKAIMKLAGLATVGLLGLTLLVLWVLDWRRGRAAAGTAAATPEPPAGGEVKPGLGA
jgi:protein SCO1/2